MGLGWCQCLSHAYADCHVHCHCHHDIFGYWSLLLALWLLVPGSRYGYGKDYGYEWLLLLPMAMAMAIAMAFAFTMARARAMAMAVAGVALQVLANKEGEYCSEPKTFQLGCMLVRTPIKKPAELAPETARRWQAVRWTSKPRPWLEPLSLGSSRSPLPKKQRVPLGRRSCMQPPLLRVTPRCCRCPAQPWFDRAGMGELLVEPNGRFFVLKCIFLQLVLALHEPADLARGWQRTASKVDSLQISSVRLMRRSLHCSTPWAVPWPAVCTPPSSRCLDSAAYRVLLLRRLRLPLPLDAVACRCGIHLEPWVITGQLAHVLDSSAVEAFP